VSDETKASNLDEITQLLQNLEKRISRIENYLEIGLPESLKETTGEDIALLDNTPKSEYDESSLELRIGGYWLAWVGAFVLTLGIAFLVSYPFFFISSAIISLIGYLLVGGVFGLSKYWNESYPHLSKILFGSGLILGYYVTLRLHFFNDTPVLTNNLLGIGLLVVACILIFHQTVRRRSEPLSGIAVLLCYLTALLSDSTPLIFLFISFTAITTAYLLIRFNWQRIVWFSIPLAYFSHLLWMVNNPLLGKPIQAVSAHHYNFIYLFVYATVFSLANLFRDKDAISDLSELIITVINSLGFFIVGMLSLLTFYKANMALLNFGMAIFFIVIAALNWMRHKNKYASAVYACFGYLALSIAILSQFEAPYYFVWLCWQSLLVISTALWFHSRIIIVVNFLIFFGILLTNLWVSVANDVVNLSYAVVALVSARILNWKKERLELKTEMMRNAYLVTAFIAVLYGLFHAVPDDFVGLAWLGAALFYFAMSRLLSNRKYRWMAILTIFATVLHVFFVDLARVNAAFRIILFLAVGLVLLIVSLLYTKMQKKDA